MGNPSFRKTASGKKNGDAELRHQLEAIGQQLQDLKRSIEKIQARSAPHPPGPEYPALPFREAPYFMPQYEQPLSSLPAISQPPRSGRSAETGRWIDEIMTLINDPKVKQFMDQLTRLLDHGKPKK